MTFGVVNNEPHYEGIPMQINFKQAYKITSANRYRIFAKSDKTAGKSGYERICREFADINHSPKFSLSSNDKVFTIGSCFARNIELWLARKGIKSITSDCIIPGELYEATGLGARNGALNAYTPSSMQELVKLGQADNIELGTLKTGDDEFYDMMVSGLRPLNFEELTLVRDKVCSTYRRIGEAKTIIITLGYTESWFDTE